MAEGARERTRRTTPRSEAAGVTRRNGGGRRRASMREVAALADVAISSVSRVLSGHPDVSAEMRDRVLDAVRRLEYAPDFLAQSLRRGQTLSVGFVLADIGNPLMAGIVTGAEAGLRAAGYSLVLMDSENDPELDAAHLRFFAGRRVDGVILSLASDEETAVLDLLRDFEAPVVLVDRTLPPEYGASAVFSDHAGGMAAAVEHLLALGHRRIALVTGSLGLLPGRERVAGLRRAVAGRADVTALELTGSFSAEHGAAATRAILAMEPRPTALIAGGNQILIGCIRELQAAGVRVGSDLSLVTCDDIPLSELYQPPIATIGREIATIGRTAAELLLRRLAEDRGPETVVLPTTFTPRASCAPPPRG